MNFRYPHPDNEKSSRNSASNFSNATGLTRTLSFTGDGVRPLDIDIIDPTFANPFKAAQCKHHESLITIPPSQ